MAALSLVGGGVYAWKRFESSAPTVEGPSALIIGSVSRKIDFEIADAESGLREIRVTVRQGERESVALERAFEGNWRVGGSGPRKPEQLEIAMRPRSGRARARVRPAWHLPPYQFPHLLSPPGAGRWPAAPGPRTGRAPRHQEVERRRFSCPS